MAADTATTCCPSCGAHDTAGVLSGRSAPVTSSSVFPTAAEAAATSQGEIDLVCCRRCALIFNRAFVAELAELGACYESSQAGSAHFSAFARSLSDDWIARYALTGKSVLEVGSGQGAFLCEMLRGGVAEAVALDPLALASDIPDELQARVRIDAINFGPAHADIRAAALVCRHTVEHVGDVSGFLRLVAAWSRANGRAPVLFEAPSAERILDEGAFWDISYEHCNYFTRPTLERAFRLAGLDVTRSELVYDGQYLIIEGRAAEGALEADFSTAPAELEQALKFERHAKAAIQACRARLQAMAADGGPVALWQAAAKTVALLSWLGPDAPIDCAVDINPRRHGLYIPPAGLQVRAPEDLARIRPRHVVLMNPVYAREVRAALDQMGLETAELHAIDQVAAP